MMKSNGFGRWNQKIVVTVAKQHAELVGKKLGLVPFKEAGDPARAYFVWERLTVRPGNDEDVVFDLSAKLADAQEKINWHIDWRASEY